jgi:transposase
MAMATKTSRSSEGDPGEIVSAYYGVDLHKEQITWHAILVSKNGYIGRTNGVVGTTKILDDFVPLLDCQPSFLIVEASSSGFYFHSLVASHCKKALVVNPSAFRELFMTGKKTDRIDARKLADRLKYHIEMGEEDAGFPEVFVPDAEALAVRRLVTTYELLVKQGTQLKNQLKAVFASKIVFGYEDVLDTGIDQALVDSRLDRADRAIIKSLKASHDALMAEKEAIKREILEIGVARFRHEVELLIGISGVSIMGAVVFMSDVVTISRFASAKRLTAYLASVGKVDASGGTIRNGSLNKRGRRTAYRFILQGLIHIIAGNKGFSDFSKRHAGTRPNKVRAAIVRKTFVTMYFMLKNEEPYRFFDERIYKRKKKEFVSILAKVA